MSQDNRGEFRRFARLPKEVMVEVTELTYPMPAEPGEIVQSKDVSAVGICFISATLFAPGTILTVNMREWPIANGIQSSNIRARKERNLVYKISRIALKVTIEKPNFWFSCNRPLIRASTEWNWYHLPCLPRPVRFRTPEGAFVVFGLEFIRAHIGEMTALIVDHTQVLKAGEFFTPFYKILLDKERGPRLAPFLIALGDKATKLLEKI